ncbi:MAG: DNA polymerase III subunit [Planctomycetes bacterium]|nr:DNA polymerase III subunit [Planctomycetota bacterium]
MSWHGILGQDHVFEQFEQTLAHGRLASTYLFVGPPGVGKRSTALAIGQALLCSSRKDDLLQACRCCPACIQVEKLSHADLEVISKPPDQSAIPLEALIGSREKRLREGLCYNLSLKPFHGGRKIAIIDDADYLNTEGANCLLKTLEEPPPHSLLILIGTSAQRQLPTIRSRCQLIRFRPLDLPTLTQLIVDQGYAAATEAEQMARLAEGSLQRARELSDGALREFRIGWLGELSTGDFWSAELLKQVAGFVESAGTDAPSRRNRLRAILSFTLQFYRLLLHASCGHAIEADDCLVESVRVAQRSWKNGHAGIISCIENCLEALGQIDANAHLNTVIDVWFDEVSLAAR